MATSDDRRDAHLDRLVDAVLAVASDLSLPTVLQRIIDAATSLVGARYGALGVLGPDHMLSEFVTSGVDLETVQRIGPLPEGKGILGLLIVDSRPLRLSDLTKHPDSFGFPPNHPLMQSFLGVPILVRDSVFGNLYLTEKIDEPEFTEKDEQLAVALAAVAATAVENARLHEQVGDLAVLFDRERIARDLHDKVVQRLFAAGMALQATQRVISDGSVAARIEDAVDALDETIREIRSTIFALSTGPLGGNLRARVLELTHELEEPLGFEPRVHFDGPVDALIPADIAIELLATLREALTNVAKHASAGRADVVVQASNEVMLRVLDDGKGVETGIGSARGNERGHGLRNMTERAMRLGGNCTVEPRPGGGTVLDWRVPLPG